MAHLTQLEWAGRWLGRTAGTVEVAATVGVALLTAAAGGSALAAQEPLPLDAVAVAVARWWELGDAEGIASVVAEGGARLNVEDERHPALARRQVRATLEALFSARPAGAVAVERTEVVGGSPLRAWAHLRWETAAAGTSEALLYRVFIGFVQVEGRWRIDEIRVLR